MLPLKRVKSRRHICARILLDAGASVLLKNAEGWSPFQEATSFGNRDIMAMLFRKRFEELGSWFAGKGRELMDALAKVGCNGSSLYLFTLVTYPRHLLTATLTL